MKTSRSWTYLADLQQIEPQPCKSSRYSHTKSSRFDAVCSHSVRIPKSELCKPRFSICGRESDRSALGLLAVSTFGISTLSQRPYIVLASTLGRGVRDYSLLSSKRCSIAFFQSRRNSEECRRCRKSNTYGSRRIVPCYRRWGVMCMNFSSDQTAFELLSSLCQRGR